MNIDTQSGLLAEARQCPSPNCNERPTTDMDLLVVHNISLPPGQFGGPHIDALFTNTLDPCADDYFADIVALQVSAHLLIRRDGEVVQYVPFHMRAWHAGDSDYCGREQCNDYSIGIELEGTDDMPYQEIQYERLAEVVVALVNSYPDLSTERITGHSDIAPGRKTDPGPAFDWSHFRGMLECVIDNQ